jgi:membrane-bound inhibitor of C-type lysozyme
MTGETMTRIGSACLLIGAVLFATASSAQSFVSYICADGTRISAVFFKGERSMRMQLDGRALSLPQRLAASGARYAKGGVSFWIKGQEATLKRPRQKATLCKVN